MQHKEESNREIDIDLQWILGFIEGEGSFIIAATKNDRMELDIYVRPRFSLTLSQRDTNTLEQLKCFLENKNIKTIIQKYDRRKMVILTVRGVNQCLKIAELLKTLKWHTKKRNDFDKWCEALEVFQEIASRKSDHKNIKWMKEDVIKLLNIRDQMNLQFTGKRQFNQNNAVTFKRKWNMIE